MKNAFELLNANRKAANAVYGIFKITKSGDLSKVASGTARTEAEALMLQARYTALNPGKQFVVKAL